MTYPHKEIVRAYLEGKAIEFLHPYSQKWEVRCEKGAIETATAMPSFSCDSKYRVAPEKKEYAIMRSRCFPGNVTIIEACLLNNYAITWKDTGERIWL